ncbi:hypothetical protein FPQ18DRAFT_386071 [Pyronema domesticum]|nr:hypothetical protein FPQ18DRAFT_386071 [Pyronema domesticum]
MDYSKGRNPVPGSMEALHQPLHEATIVHSYIVPTGLWLCKASFVAMYFNLKRHLNVRTKRLLHFTVFYLLASFVVLVLTHALWCGPKFGHTWSETSNRFCTPFANTVSIAVYAFMNITSDIFVLAIPLMILHYITVLPRERYAIIFLLFLGLGTIVTTATCCGLHIAYRKQLLVYYNYIQLAELLACVELAVGIAAVSLPSLKAVLYLKQESRRNKIKSSGVGSSKRTACTTGEWDEDEGRLVIMRRMSYDVESMEVPKEAVIKEGRA